MRARDRSESLTTWTTRALALGGALILTGLLTAPSMAQGNADCGPTPTPGGAGYGPYDFRTDRDKLGLVERFHFTAPVEALVRGATGPIGGDLEYTLDKFPNHHRALLATMRLAAREKVQRIPAMTYRVECYFDRAIRFRRDDTVVRGLYAMYLHANGRKDDALQQLEVATGLAKDNPFTHQSIGLIYLDLQETEKARERATAAYRLGLTQSELIKRLSATGQWDASAAAAPASAPSAAGS